MCVKLNSQLWGNKLKNTSPGCTRLGIYYTSHTILTAGLSLRARSLAPLKCGQKKVLKTMEPIKKTRTAVTVPIASTSFDQSVLKKTHGPCDWSKNDWKLVLRHAYSFLVNFWDFFPA